MAISNIDNEVVPSDINKYIPTHYVWLSAVYSHVMVVLLFRIMAAELHDIVRAAVQYHRELLGTITDEKQRFKVAFEEVMKRWGSDKRVDCAKFGVDMRSMVVGKEHALTMMVCLKYHYQRLKRTRIPQIAKLTFSKDDFKVGTVKRLKWICDMCKWFFDEYAVQYQSKHSQQVILWCASCCYSSHYWNHGLGTV